MFPCSLSAGMTTEIRILVFSLSTGPDLFLTFVKNKMSQVHANSLDLVVFLGRVATLSVYRWQAQPRIRYSVNGNCRATPMLRAPVASL